MRINSKINQKTMKNLITINKNSKSSFLNLKNSLNFSSSSKSNNNLPSFYRTLWGYDVKLENIHNDSKDGFQGYEIAWSFTDKEFYKKLSEKMQENNLNSIIQLHTSGQNIDSHTESFENQLKEIQEKSSILPELINCHSGVDSWEIKNKINFFEKIRAISDKPEFKKLKISHETHRGRCFNNPREFLEIIKKVKVGITLDVSHWVLSYERLLTEENLEIYNEVFSYIKNNTN